MELTFALSNGTCAGLVMPQALSEHPAGQAITPCSGPDKDLPVVFYVSNKLALDRVMARFGALED